MTAPVQHSADHARPDDAPSAQRIGATDAVVRVDTATPCGTDLHLLQGIAPTVSDESVSGHRSLGTVIEVGSAVVTVHIGDRLLVTCTSSRGHQRSLHHRCRLVAEADGQPSHATSSTPGSTRPTQDSGGPG